MRSQRRGAKDRWDGRTARVPGVGTSWPARGRAASGAVARTGRACRQRRWAGPFKDAHVQERADGEGVRHGI
eukprot:6193581-Pleurochrysis_carterae.AAC.2